MKLFKNKIFVGLFTMGVIVAIILLNILATVIAEKYDLKIDVTSEKVYEISDVVKETISSISEPVNIYILSENGDVKSITEILRVYQYIKNLSNISKYISVTVIDLEKNPTFINDYVFSENDSYDLLIVQSDKRYKTIPYSELYGKSEESSYLGMVDEFYAEQEIISAVSYVTSERVSTAYFLGGHGEAQADGLASFLQSQNYHIDEIVPFMQDIPKDADLLILSCPENDYEQEEIQKLREYMENGGNMFVFYFTSTGQFSNLSEFFEEWGISFQQAQVFDPLRSYYSGEIFPFLTEHEINKSFSKKSYLFAPNCVPITIKDDAQQNSSLKVSTLFETSDSAYIKQNGFESQEKQSDDISGKFNIGVLSENSDNGGQIVFIGTPNLAYWEFLSSKSFINNDYMAKLTNYLVEQEGNVVVPFKKLSGSMLMIFYPVTTIIFYTLVILIPLTIICIGAFRWFKRRSL